MPHAPSQGLWSRVVKQDVYPVFRHRRAVDVVTAFGQYRGCWDSEYCGGQNGRDVIAPCRGREQDYFKKVL